jgi:hypothetical protein
LLQIAPESVEELAGIDDLCLAMTCGEVAFVAGDEKVG